MKKRKKHLKEFARFINHSIKRPGLESQLNPTASDLAEPNKAASKTEVS